METAVESAVGFLLQNLLQLIQDNYDLISGAGSKVTSLSTNLRLLKSFVIQYTEKHYENMILRDLAKQIRGVIHEAEDAIEEYIYYTALQNNKGMIGQALNKVEHKLNIRAVSKKIDEVSERVMKMYQDNFLIGDQALRLEEAENSTRGGIAKKQKPGGVKGLEKVIGFEDAAIQVIELLTGKKLDQPIIAELEQQNKPHLEQKTETEQIKTEFEQLEVVSIVGMLGLGKTTLARKVLSDPRIEYEFFTRIFVPVSSEYDRREVFQTILVKGGFFKNINELIEKSDEDLVVLIKEKLKNKYLIVMDDVWTTEAWDDLKGIFPDYKKGSRVLITTRHNFVAEYSKSKINPYKLRFLHKHESRELLRTKVFDENRLPEELEVIETEILGKCQDLPLAIVVTAGILRNKRESKKWWQDVANGVNLDNLVNGQDNQGQSDKLIKLSYDHLPYQLKPCFLYLGVFPEDVEIPVWKLFRLWIAEGFIQQAPDISLEEIAEVYLRELVDRNLVMVGQIRSNGQIKTCRVHDTLRYFCKKMAIEEKLFQEIKSKDEATGSSTGNSRRLCIDTYLSDYISRKPLPSAPCVRSLLSFAKDGIALQKEDCPLVFKPFKLLKVMDIKSIKLIGRLPSELPNLVLLKYIAISCELKILPKKMSSLVHLQTIIIDTTSGTLEIQADLWSMTKLRHLHTNASTSLPKCQEQYLVNLQTLSTISPDSCKPELFERTPKLKKLGISGKLGTLVRANGESSLFDCLYKLESLENLKLLNDDINFKLHALPQENKFPAKLTRLSLQNTNLDWSQMSTLGKLKYLEALKLKDNAFKGKYWQTEDGGFRSLTVLSIGATDLAVWKAQASNFPKLTCLVLKHCNKLEGIPPGLADIKSLQMIDLECTNSSVVNSARKIIVLQLQVLRQRRDTETNEIKLKVYPPE